MGYIDQTTHTLTCKCGTTENVTILEHGSQYGASWGAEKPFKMFDATWVPGTFRGPEIAKATCNACGASAQITMS